MKMIAFGVLVVTVAGLSVCGCAGHALESGVEENVFAKKLFYSKGGFGKANPNVFIFVKSAKNELRLRNGEHVDRWTGKDAGTREVVIVFNNRVWSPSDVPTGFDLSNATVVSFEGEIVRFFDFGTMTGGYYRWLGPN
jgi:hypothetical protein